MSHMIMKISIGVSVYLYLQIIVEVKYLNK